METNFVHCKSKRYFNCYDFPKKKKIYKGYNIIIGKKYFRGGYC